jgi:hypothetical protein
MAVLDIGYDRVVLCWRDGEMRIEGARSRRGSAVDCVGEERGVRYTEKRDRESF